MQEAGQIVANFVKIPGISPTSWSLGHGNQASGAHRPSRQAPVSSSSRALQSSLVPAAACSTCLLPVLCSWLSWKHAQCLFRGHLPPHLHPYQCLGSFRAELDHLSACSEQLIARSEPSALRTKEPTLRVCLRLPPFLRQVGLSLPLPPPSCWLRYHGALES